METLEDAPLTSGLKAFLFLQEKKTKNVFDTWEGSAFKLITDYFLK